MPSSDREDTLEVEILRLGSEEHLAGFGVIRLTRDDLIALAAANRTLVVKVYGALVIETGTGRD